MKKIPTIFVRDWEGTIGPPARFVLDEHHPDCEWVFAGEGVATRKLDGAACLLRDGRLYKRQEIKPPKPDPADFELVEEDNETGKRVGWIPVGDGPEDKWFREGFAASMLVDEAVLEDGTYELVGPKVQGNPEGFHAHHLVPHSSPSLLSLGTPPTDYETLKNFLAPLDIEGIVWHHPDGRMAKIKKKDFGLKRS